MNLPIRLLRLVSFLVLVLCSHPLFAVPGYCDACGGTFNGTSVTYTDKVDGNKKWVCEPCADLATECFSCGVPAYKDHLTISDGRIYCKRDRVGLVLEEEEALAICADVDRTLEALLGRFATFPSTNVEVRLLDRVDVRTLVGVAGYDFGCPNLLGCTLSLQKPGYQLHEIRLMTGLQKGVLQATYAHELAHAWVSENVSRARELELDGDAAEGFCELIGFLVAEAYRDEMAKKHVLKNQYTRGQVLLFIETERRFGVGDVFDWMQQGESSLLEADDLDAIREVKASKPVLSRPVSEILFIPTAPARIRDSLELTSIIIGPRLSIATINGRAFEVNEERKVPLGGSNIVLRCLSIEPKSALVEHVKSGKQERLSLGTLDQSSSD